MTLGRGQAELDREPNRERHRQRPRDGPGQGGPGHPGADQARNEGRDNEGEAGRDDGNQERLPQPLPGSPHRSAAFLFQFPDQRLPLIHHFAGEIGVVVFFGDPPFAVKR